MQTKKEENRTMIEDNIADLVESGTELAIQENNKRIDMWNRRWLLFAILVFSLFGIVLLWIIYKIVVFDAFNNAIRTLGGC